MVTHVRVMQKCIDMDKPMFSSENKDNCHFPNFVSPAIKKKKREIVKDKLLIPEKRFLSQNSHLFTCGLFSKPVYLSHCLIIMFLLPFWIFFQMNLLDQRKTNNFCCQWIWKKGIDIQYETLSYELEVWQPRFNLAGFSPQSSPTDSHSEHCRKPVFIGTRDDYDNACRVVQPENVSSVHVPIRSNFVIGSYLQSFWL